MNREEAKMRRSRGLTLMELLVVVAVMVILLGAALPLLKTGLAGRRTREVSRELGTYVELAKSASAETGREAGLILQVDTLPENGLRYVSQLFLAEIPRPYAGDMVGARAVVHPDPSQNRFEITFSASASLTTTLPTALILGGESFEIKFDYKGPTYQCQRDPDPSNLDFVVLLGSAPPPPGFWNRGLDGVWGTANGGATSNGDDDDNGIVNDLREAGWPGSDDIAVGLPYQIFRRPQKSSSTPLQLSSGAVIDLSMSGFGLAEENIFDRTMNSGVISEVESVAILFGPSGEMTRVLVNRIQTDTNASPVTQTPITITNMPTDTLHLLIGGIDGVLLDDIANVNVGDDLETNIENPDNLWVSIGHQAGRATTAENGWTQGSPLSMPLARQFAQSSEAMGGR